MPFTDTQKAALRSPLDRANVRERQQAGRSLSYIEAWKAIDEANRIFGFDGWSSETVDIRCVSEKERQVGKGQYAKPGWGVTYVGRVRVTVWDGERWIAREGVGAGHGIDADLGLAHESAIKECESDCRKRGLMTFGNPFGLALYDKTQESVSTNVPDAMAESTSKEPVMQPKQPKAQAPAQNTSGKPSHIIAPAADPKALALKKQEEQKKAADDFKAESATLADEWCKVLASRYEQASAASSRDEVYRLREAHAAWTQTAKVCWKKLTVADQSRVKRARMQLEDVLQDGVLNEIAAIAKEQAA